MTATWVWLIAAGTIAGVLFRPRQWPEAVWACLGAGLLVLFQFLSVEDAARAIAKGTDVYLFLTGMMLLADLARREGVFDWLASLAVAAARGSRERLFALVYGVGVLVTVFLSNDATAVVLTPAVYVAVKKARVEARPYLLTCAFIANAASFVLPISNPANLVVYGKTLPPLLPWLRVFALPSVLAVASTYGMLRWLCAKELKGPVPREAEKVLLTGSGRRAAVGLALTALVLVGASASGHDLGWPTLIAALLAALVATAGKPGPLWAMAREVSWSVLPLVAGLFVLVEALTAVGATREVGSALQNLQALPAWGQVLGASFGVAGLCNVMNNLPAGLLAGEAVRAAAVPDRVRDAVMVGVDLGPNLSVTGSLATVLWLIALRREGEQVSAWQFLKVGALVMPPALLLAGLGLLAG